MVEVVKAPNVEAVIITYLNGVLTPPVSSEVPAPRPTLFVRVVEVPFEGIRQVALYRALLSLEFWGAKKTEAKDLALTALAHLSAAEGFVADPGSPGYLPDPVSGTPRYVATCEVVAVAVAI